MQTAEMQLQGVQFFQLSEGVVFFSDLYSDPSNFIPFKKLDGYTEGRRLIGYLGLFVPDNGNAERISDGHRFPFSPCDKVYPAI